MIEGGTPVEEVVDTGDADDEDDRPEGHRRRGAHAGAEMRVEDRDCPEDGERDETAEQMIARRRPGLRVDEVVVDDRDRRQPKRE